MWAVLQPSILLIHIHCMFIIIVILTYLTHVSSNSNIDGVLLPYTRYFSRVLYFADNLPGRIFAFKFSLIAYLNANCSIPYSLLIEIFEG